MNIIILDKTYLMEFLSVNPAGGNANQVSLPVLNNLDGKLLMGLTTYSPSIVSLTPGKSPLVNDAALKCSYLNLFVGDVNQIWNVPLVDLMNNQNFGQNNSFVPFSTEFNNLKIIWAKSFVFVADPTLLVPTESFMFNIRYADAATQMDTK